MMKNTVDPMATQTGVLAALLAEKGYTGPEHVLDGKEGLVHCLGPEWKLDVLTDGLGESWRITAVRDEGLPHRGAHPHADLGGARPRAASTTSSPSRSRRCTSARWPAPPTSWPTRPSTTRARKETADHSLPYVIAAAIVDRQVTPAQFTDAKIMDPAIRAQLRKVEVVADPEIEKVFPALQRVIVDDHARPTAASSRRQLDYPKGDPRNPLTDAEIEEKFDALAEPVLVAPRARRRSRTRCGTWRSSARSPS